MDARRLVWIGLGVLSMGLYVRAAQAPAPQSDPTQTVLDAVYTAEQAEYGAAAYEEHCAHCHEGGEPDAEPPKGSAFIDRWREAPLSFLYTQIATNMPGDSPGSLPAETSLDILAYLLAEHDYPAGTTPLTADRLDAVRLVGPDGPQPLPPSALVRVVGCLSPGPAAGTGQLTAATAPDRVRRADSTTPEEQAISAAAAPGTATYQLRNVPATTPPGQRVQAKGVFNSQGSTATLSVLSLVPVGGACGQ